MLDGGAVRVFSLRIDFRTDEVEEAQQAGGCVSHGK